MKKAIKDVQRGTANCDVLQESSVKGSAHVTRMTPLETKAQQMKAAKELGIDAKREKGTSRRRADKEVKAL